MNKREILKLLCEKGKCGMCIKKPGHCLLHNAEKFTIRITRTPNPKQALK